MSSLFFEAQDTAPSAHKYALDAKTLVVSYSV